MTKRSEYHDDTPALKKFDPRNPPDIKTLSLRFVRTDNLTKRHYYTNDYYKFDIDESRIRERYNGCGTEVSILAESSKGLYDIRLICCSKSPAPQCNWHPATFWVDLRPPKITQHEHDLFNRFETERLILAKTLLDLNEIVTARYGMRVLGDESIAEYRRELRKAGVYD